MFNRSGQANRFAGMSVVALLLSGTVVLDTNAWQQPVTPCPCAADGVCRPNGPWGHTPTKWRPWPGDALGEAPPSAEEAEAREQLQLDPFELPPITKEGQRGPNVNKPPKAAREDATVGEPALDNLLNPAAPLPEAGAEEEFDPGAFGGEDQFNPAPPAQDELQPLDGLPPVDGLQPDDKPEDEAQPGIDPLGRL